MKANARLSIQASACLRRGAIVASARVSLKTWTRRAVKHSPSDFSLLPATTPNHFTLLYYFARALVAVSHLSINVLSPLRVSSLPELVYFREGLLLPPSARRAPLVLQLLLPGFRDLRRPLEAYLWRCVLLVQSLFLRFQVAPSAGKLSKALALASEYR